MKSLTRMALVDLQQLVRTDSALRVAAWAEINYRNTFRQQIERENGLRKAFAAGPVTPIRRNA